MEVDFWHRKWREGEIGFHQETVNPFLRQYWPRLEPPGQVFAPLCGKSGDMAWLAACGQGVLGIEISALAIEAFFRENALPCTREEGDPFTIWRGANIEILQGDFFHLEAGHLAQVQAVYDRAAMIALPPALRRRYSRHWLAILPQPVRMLLITLEYPQADMEGPPFSVTREEIEESYGGELEISLLETQDILAQNRGFQERGVSSLYQKVYLLQSR